MKRNMFLVLFFLLFLKVLLLKEESIEDLYKKYVKEINPNSYYNNIYLNENNLDLNEINIDYDFNKVKNIISKYNIQYDSYNFFDKENIQKVVQDQIHCGCCWAMATTTALSYRYNKKTGSNIELSPQYPLSCLIGNCNDGTHDADGDLFLVNPGTVSKNCFPYTSGNKVVPSCPKKCVDSSNLNFYRAKKFYYLNNFSKQNYYEIVALIMDQIIKEGPVEASIPVFEDFHKLYNYKCPTDYIYSYDGTSAQTGYHMVVIVGYGYINNKYYWIVQNSWGKAFCDGGLVKIEFGQTGIEQEISFMIPYIKKSVPQPVQVDLTLKTLDFNDKCLFEVEAITDYWVDTIEITYKHKTNNKDQIKFQCSANEIVGGQKTINCYFSSMEYSKSEGYYIFDKGVSLFNENTFLLTNFVGSEFYFIGPQILAPFIHSIKYPKPDNETYYFVSEKGSMILFNAEKMGDNPNMPRIYADSNELKNCKREKFPVILGYTYLVKCSLEKKEINYFSTNYKEPVTITNSYLCGNKIRETKVKVFQLDKNKYPVLKLKKLSTCAKSSDNKTLRCYIETFVQGSLSNYEYRYNEFATLVRLKTENDVNQIKQMNCSNLYISHTGQKFFTCEIENNPYDSYKNIYVLPYYWIVNFSKPFEVIINDELPLFARSYLKLNSIFILLIILLI